MGADFFGGVEGFGKGSLLVTGAQGLEEHIVAFCLQR
jgi:hypothetical protein